MQHSAEMRRMLIALDLGGLRRLWAAVAPNMPKPKSDNEALVVAHHARTQMQTIPPRHRFYSHRWLLDNGYTSGLPDNLKPSAERMYPRVVEAVGISLSSASEIIRPAIPIIRGAMECSVLESYADGLKDPAVIKKRMLAAKDRSAKELFGIRRST